MFAAVGDGSTLAGNASDISGHKNSHDLTGSSRTHGSRSSNGNNQGRRNLRGRHDHNDGCVVESKADAAMAILVSGAYLWDFFLGSNAHTFIGLSRECHAYVTLREFLEEAGAGDGQEGGQGGTGLAAAVGPGAGDGGVDVDAAVTVGKALLEVQRQVLRKVSSTDSCSSVVLSVGFGQCICFWRGWSMVGSWDCWVITHVCIDAEFTWIVHVGN